MNDLKISDGVLYLHLARAAASEIVAVPKPRWTIAHNALATLSSDLVSIHNATCADNSTRLTKTSVYRVHLYRYCPLFICFQSVSVSSPVSLRLLSSQSPLHLSLSLYPPHLASPAAGPPDRRTAGPPPDCRTGRVGRRHRTHTFRG